MKNVVLLLIMVMMGANVLAESGPELSDLLRPSVLKLSILPNSEGFDGKFAMTYKWSKELSSGIEASYSGGSSSVKDTGSASIFEAKSFQKDYAAWLSVIEFLWPIDLGNNTGVGLGAAIDCAYTGVSQSISGYKTAQEETVYFNQDKLIHRLIPTVDFKAAAAFGPHFTAEATGSFLPYVLMFETGSKRYSTYTVPITYSLQNSCMGWKATLGLATVNLGIGDFMVKVSATGLFGKYGTQEEVIAGSYKTTIKMYQDYQNITGDAFIEYHLSYLKNILLVVPALTFGCTAGYETFGSETPNPTLTWKLGLSIGSR